MTLRDFCDKMSNIVYGKDFFEMNTQVNYVGRAMRDNLFTVLISLPRHSGATYQCTRRFDKFTFWDLPDRALASVTEDFVEVTGCCNITNKTTAEKFQCEMKRFYDRQLRRFKLFTQYVQQECPNFLDKEKVTYCITVTAELQKLFPDNVIGEVISMDYNNQTLVLLHVCDGKKYKSCYSLEFATFDPPIIIDGDDATFQPYTDKLTDMRGGI